MPPNISKAAITLSRSEFKINHFLDYDRLKKSPADKTAGVHERREILLKKRMNILLGYRRMFRHVFQHLVHLVLVLFRIQHALFADFFPELNFTHVLVTAHTSVGTQEGIKLLLIEGTA